MLFFGQALRSGEADKPKSFSDRVNNESRSIATPQAQAQGDSLAGMAP